MPHSDEIERDDGVMIMMMMALTLGRCGCSSVYGLRGERVRGFRERERECRERVENEVSGWGKEREKWGELGYCHVAV